MAPKRGVPLSNIFASKRKREGGPAHGEKRACRDGLFGATIDRATGSAEGETSVVGDRVARVRAQPLDRRNYCFGLSLPAFEHIVTMCKFPSFPSVTTPPLTGSSS